MAVLQNVTIDGTDFLKLPTGTTAERPSNPEEGYTRFNTDNDIIEVYNGQGWSSLNGEMHATVSGDVYTTEIFQDSKKFRVHVFTGNGTFTPNTAGEVEYLIVAGGGAGGRHHGGGGGGGGVLQGRTIVSQQSYSITVGNGGIPTPGTGSSPNGNGGNGENSSAFGLTAVGGGGGGNYSSGDGADGGSGGGAQNWTQGRTGGAGTPGQGFAGGNSSGQQNDGGGGGGAGEPGGQGPAGNDGGAGIASEITGMRIYYGGGGNAGVYDDGSSRDNLGTGGVRGFGGGGYQEDTQHGNGNPANPGGINSGGGGAGNPEYTASAGAGGSGIVIVRYKIKENSLNFKFDTNTKPVSSGLFFHVDPALLTSYNWGEFPELRDLTRKGCLGTVYDNMLWSTEGNGAFVSNTYPAYITTGQDNTINNIENFTLSCWLKKTTSQDAYLILGTRLGNNTNQSLSIINGKLNLHKYSFSGNSDLNVATGTTNLDDSQWHYCAITYRAGNTRTYVDGQLEAEEFHENTSTNNNNLQVNYNQSVSQTYRFYIGLIGPILVYDRELTQPEIKHNFEVYRWRYGV